MSRPSKRRKTQKAVEEINFDPDARHEYLTGFRKRKQQRIKHAQEEAAKKERELKILQRKQIREKREQDIKAHVEAVNAMIKKAEQGADSEDDMPEQASWDGAGAAQDSEVVADEDIGHEDEYIDEGKHTTVTVEPMNMSESENDTDEQQEHDDGGANAESGKDIKGGTRRLWTKENPNKDKPKKKRKKFRYESKVERKAERFKQKAKKGAAARARRDA